MEPAPPSWWDVFHARAEKEYYRALMIHWHRESDRATSELAEECQRNRDLTQHLARSQDEKSELTTVIKDRGNTIRAREDQIQSIQERLDNMREKMKRASDGRQKWEIDARLSRDTVEHLEETLIKQMTVIEDHTQALSQRDAALEAALAANAQPLPPPEVEPVPDAKEDPEEDSEEDPVDIGEPEALEAAPLDEAQGFEQWLDFVDWHEVDAPPQPDPAPIMDIAASDDDGDLTD